MAVAEFFMLIKISYYGFIHRLRTLFKFDFCEIIWGYWVFDDLDSRYIPLNRTTIPISSIGSPGPDYSFPSLTTCDELETKASTTLVKCKFGSVEAAAKVCN